MFDSEFGKGFSLFAIVLGVILVLASIFRINFSSTPKKEEIAGYEMIRPSEYTGGFDLSGREIDRIVKGGQKLAEVASPAKAALVKAGAAAPKAKLVNNRSKNAAAAAAYAAAQKRRKGSLTLNTVNTRGDSMGPRFTLDSIDTNRATNPTPNLGRVADVEPQTPPAPVVETQEENRLSFAQWRSLLQSQPTSANAAAFLKAHAQGEIDHNSFYQIALELFSDSAEDRRKIGMMLLNQDTTLAGFEPISKAYAKASEAQRSDLWKVLLGYGQPAKFSGLATAFNSSDKNVVMMAGQVLNTAIQSYKQRPVLASVAEAAVRTAAAVTSSNANSFKIFIPVLTKLSKSTDLGIAQMAKSLLDSIQSLLPS